MRSGTRDEPQGRGGAFVADVGAVLLAWVAVIALENLVVGVGWREQYAGSWEMAHARYYLSPIALAVGLPLAVMVVAIGRLIAARDALAILQAVEEC